LPRLQLASRAGISETRGASSSQLGRHPRWNNRSFIWVNNMKARWWAFHTVSCTAFSKPKVRARRSKLQQPASWVLNSYACEDSDHLSKKMSEWARQLTAELSWRCDRSGNVVVVITQKWKLAKESEETADKRVYDLQLQVEMDGLQLAVHRAFNLRSIQWKISARKKQRMLCRLKNEIKEDLGITEGKKKSVPFCDRICYSSWVYMGGLNVGCV